MAFTWQQRYLSLTNYLSNNPDIVINMNKTVIPATKKEEFYALFNATRQAFLHDHCYTILADARSLQNHLASAFQDIKTILNIKDVVLPPYLADFVHEPEQRLMIELFDPLLTLLKGKISLDAFSSQAISSVLTAFNQLFQQSYEKWVALSIVDLLKAGKAYYVPFIREDLFTPRYMEPYKFGKVKTVALPPEPTDKLSFVHQSHPVFIVSDFIVYSPLSNGFLSFRTELDMSKMAAESYSANQEWLSLEPLRSRSDYYNMQPGLLIHMDSKLEELSLIADYHQFLRPDIIIECMHPITGVKSKDYSVYAGNRSISNRDSALT
jgi:hypothetical protein